jgi:hypothetical protein
MLVMISRRACVNVAGLAVACTFGAWAQEPVPLVAPKSAVPIPRAPLASGAADVSKSTSLPDALGSTSATQRDTLRALGIPVDPAQLADQAVVRQVVLDMAREGYRRIRSDLRDYTCVFIKRERVYGKLLPYQYMIAKVRHARSTAGQQIPFSVYLKFLGPPEVEGREVLYVEGENDGKLIAKKGGLRFGYITTSIDPMSELALEDNRYPITEFGIENLVRRFVEHLESSVLDDCTVNIRVDARVDERPCIAIEVTNHRPESRTRFHSARVYIDTLLQIPIHYEAYDWPAEGQNEPRLLEQYTYRQVKLNVGLTDADFDRRNPEYGFRK